MLKFDERWFGENLNGALALRKKIKLIVDELCENGYKNICWLGIGGTWASSMQATVHMKELSTIETWAENASEYLTTGNKRIGKGTIVVTSSVTGSTIEVVEALKKMHNEGTKIVGFIDVENTEMANLVDYEIVYPMNEQLKFYMIADYFMYKNNEFNDFEEMYKEFDTHLANALIEVQKKADSFAQEFAKQHWNDEFRYFVGAGNQWGATYSYAMCYWEEQLWIKTKSITAPEFFHGMFEIITKETPVTIFVGEDAQRSLSERVVNFIPRICANYTVIDTKDYELKGISEKYRGYISHHVMHAVNDRVDAHMEKETCHPMEIRRYYRKLKY